MNILPDLKPQSYTQSYAPGSKIDGVQVVTIKTSVGDEGDFGEVLRLDDKGHLVAFPDFQLKQINRSLQFPGSVKAWHFHHNQDEVWYVPPQFQLSAGLWDIREGSATAGETMKVNLGGGASKLLFIPRGVAHGYTNYSTRPAELIYFVSNHFNLEDPDERRLPWDAKGADFWQPERD